MEYLNLNHLKYFYTVAKYKSYSKASAYLHVQQPALSKTVKALESSLGVSLFRRVGRGVEITREAEYIYARCDEIFSQVDQIIHYSKDQDAPLKKSVTIVCPDLVSSHIMPDILERITPLFPTIRPVLISGTADYMLEEIRNKKASFGLFFHLPKLGSGLRIYEKIALPFKLVISSNEYHSQKTRASFIGSREVDNTSVKAFPTVMKLREKDASTQIRISSNSLLSHKEMVLRGLGVSILPEFLVREEIKNKKLKCLLPEESFVFDLKIVVPTKIQQGDYEKALLNQLVKFF